MLEEITISAPKIPPPKPTIVVLSEYCNNDPPPIFCELPDELKFRTFSFPGVNSNASTIVTSGTTGMTTSTTTA